MGVGLGLDSVPAVREQVSVVSSSLVGEPRTRTRSWFFRVPFGTGFPRPIFLYDRYRVSVVEEDLTCWPGMRS